MTSSSLSSSWLSHWTKTVVSSVSEATSVLESGVNRASDALEKLTLTTPEMTRARQQLEHAAQDREHRRMQLARLYPWETNDPDQKILVAECQTAILQMSQSKSTFFGPFLLPPPPAVVQKKNKNNGASHDEEPATAASSSSAVVIERKIPDDELPSTASLDMLAQLQPLPRFLGENDFDLQMHVGLIEKMLAVDPNLVKMQATYQGGGGQRETKFWHNYFIHVAHGRYMAGLGLDEIWGDHVVVPSAATAGPNTTPDTITSNSTTLFMGAAVASVVGAATAAAAAGVTTTATVDDESEEEEEVVEFDDNHYAAAAAASGSGMTAADTSNSNSNGFELVPSEGSSAHGADHDDAAAAKKANKDEDDDIDIGSDYELDELEAEIARELED